MRKRLKKKEMDNKIRGNPRKNYEEKIKRYEIEI
jgi:hypothetical protein